MLAGTNIRNKTHLRRASICNFACLFICLQVLCDTVQSKTRIRYQSKIGLSLNGMETETKKEQISKNVL